MNSVRPTLPSGIPLRMRSLPIDERGYPVPFFVAYVDGKPDHRIAYPAKMARCHRDRVCHLCGHPLGSVIAFVVGPMCGVNRISSDPPSHPECAEWAAKACPFLSRPKAQRRAANLPDGVVDAPGLGIKRNPGVTLVWHTTSYRRLRVGDGVLSVMGEPTSVRFLCEGRAATREEIDTAIDSGLPLLREPAEAQSKRAVWELEAMTSVFRAIVDRAVAA